MPGEPPARDAGRVRAHRNASPSSAVGKFLSALHRRVGKVVVFHLVRTRRESTVRHPVQPIDRDKREQIRGFSPNAGALCSSRPTWTGFRRWRPHAAQPARNPTAA
jgi:hypothetical protein